MPITGYIARAVFLDGLAHGEAAKGITPEPLRHPACSPAVEPSFIEQARQPSGIVEEARRIVARQASRRFGPPGEATRGRLEAIHDTDRPETPADRVLTATGRENLPDPGGS